MIGNRYEKYLYDDFNTLGYAAAKVKYFSYVGIDVKVGMCCVYIVLDITLVTFSGSIAVYLPVVK